MRAALILGMALTAGTVTGTEPDDRIAKHFVSKDYTIAWGAVPKFDPRAELEIGEGVGHGGGMSWTRFVPGRDGVEVVTIRMEAETPEVRAKREPDHVPVTVQSGRMKAETYAALLADIAVINSATLTRVVRNESAWSTWSFWVWTRVASGNKVALDWDWAGYDGSLGATDFAKPRAAVALTREALKSVEMKPHELTKVDRAWASRVFSRGWAGYEYLTSYWWVHEWSVAMIGVVGDSSALPILRQILRREPIEPQPGDVVRPASRLKPMLRGQVGVGDDRLLPMAIHAVMRLTGQDVRTRPLDKMDVESVRKKSWKHLTNESDGQLRGISASPSSRPTNQAGDGARVPIVERNYAANK